MVHLLLYHEFLEKKCAFMMFQMKTPSRHYMSISSLFIRPDLNCVPSLYEVVKGNNEELEYEL